MSEENAIDPNAEVARLAALSLIEYGRARAEAATRLGLGVTLLDRAVKEERKKAQVGADQSEKLLQGKPPKLAEPEPWPEPVDGAALVAEIAKEISRYVVMDDGCSEAAAFWVLHAHTVDCFHFSPRLAITSPEPRCGKTTLLDLLSELVPKPLPTANATPAAIFRSIESYRPTLLMDEADTYLKKNEELRGVLNSGHRKATASVLRTVGESFEPRMFSTWCSLAIALIGSLPVTLADRSIHIRLRRRLPHEPVESFRAGRAPQLVILARKAARYALDNRSALAKADPTMPDGIFNRVADNWSPIFAIADNIGGPWPDRLRAIALTSANSRDDDKHSFGVMLLIDLREIFSELKVDAIPSGLLVAKLNQMEDRPWSECSHGRPIAPATLARLLRPFGIEPHNMRSNFESGRVLKGYSLSQFSDVWGRYLPGCSAKE